MKVTQVKCPKCELPLYMDQQDEFFYCSHCGTIHTREMQRVERIPYEIADFREGAPTENRIYVPFWKLLTDFRIKSRDVKGGFFGKIGQALKGGDKGCSLYIFVPAAQMETPAFRYWSVNLTMSNPHYRMRNDFGGSRRMPAVTNRTEAMELADFVAVTLEAEKPGTLQYLDYTLTVNEARVVYLPFVSSPSGLHLSV